MMGERTRRMPGVVIEQIFGRPMALGVVLLNVVLAIAATVVCVGAVVEGSLPAVTAVLIALPVLWWVFAAVLFVMVAYRPRVNPSRVAPIVGAAQQGVLITGRPSIARAVTCAATALAAFFIVVAVTVGGGWAVLWGALAVGALVAAVSSGIAASRPRELMLAPGGLGAASATSHAEVAWSDIAAVAPAQGYGSLIVLRVSVVPSAPSFRRRWKHPFFRARDSFDIEPTSLGLDGTLLLMGLLTYVTQPSVRAELAAGTLPGRLVDPAIGRSATPMAVAEPILRVYEPRG